MNMTEYVNQKDPQRQTRVDVLYGEFRTGLTIPAQAGNPIYTQIFLNAYPENEYILKNGQGYLFTTDQDGNPTKASCFYIQLNIFGYAMKYKLFKDGSPVIDGFDTEKELEAAYDLKKKEGYNPIKIIPEPTNIKKHLNIK